VQTIIDITVIVHLIILEFYSEVRKQISQMFQKLFYNICTL